MAIRDWPAADRPREKLLRLGVKRLSDSELLAIVIGSSPRGQSALELARETLGRCGGLAQLTRLSYPRMAKLRGFGLARYALLQAAIEIAHRTNGQSSPHRGNIADSTAASRYFRAELSRLPYEAFACIYLDTRHRIIDFEILATGTIDRAAVYPREIVRRVIDQNAAAVILGHNHPSGIACPSEEDKSLTSLLKAALALIDVAVLDHIIVGAETTTSMADLGLLESDPAARV